MFEITLITTHRRYLPGWKFELTQAMNHVAVSDEDPELMVKTYIDEFIRGSKLQKNPVIAYTVITHYEQYNDPQHYAKPKSLYNPLGIEQ